jgi:hypothetical protein
MDRVAALNPGVSVNAVELADFKVKKEIDLSLLDEVDMVILCEGEDLAIIVTFHALGTWLHILIQTTSIRQSSMRTVAQEGSSSSLPVHRDTWGISLQTQ